MLTFSFSDLFGISLHYTNITMAQGLRYATLTFGVAIAKNSTFVRKEERKNICANFFKWLPFTEIQDFKHEKLLTEIDFYSQNRCIFILRAFYMLYQIIINWFGSFYISYWPQTKEAIGIRNQFIFYSADYWSSN